MRKVYLTNQTLTIFLPVLLGMLLPVSCSRGDGFSSEKEPDRAPIDTAFIHTLVDEMTLPHEGHPSGLPSSSDWYEGPRLGYGDDPPAGWNAMIPWGQVYTDLQGNPATNSRAQIRNMEAWYYSKNESAWKNWVNTSEIEGANYAEDFENDVNIPADIRAEPAAEGGGFSATLQAGYNFHFWSAKGRVLIDPDDIDGVWVRMEGRLVLDNPEGPDDRPAARMMLSVGADYWQSIDAAWDQWKTNGDIGIGRFKYLTADWQAFHMHTLTEEELYDHPPPGP